MKARRLARSMAGRMHDSNMLSVFYSIDFCFAFASVVVFVFVVTVVEIMF